MTITETISVLKCMAADIAHAAEGLSVTDPMEDVMKQRSEAIATALSILHTWQEVPVFPEFLVIDPKTGAEPDGKEIAQTEEWAKGLIYCDINCFAMTEDRHLLLLDDCDNTAYPPPDRFKVVFRPGTECGVPPRDPEHSKPGWISVKDALPGLSEEEWDSVTVIACCDATEVIPMVYERAVVRGKVVERWKYCWGRIADVEVTHWMPLPEPPKENTT